MTGPLDVAELRRLAEDGSVDTVIVCFPDMQGRPVGKRVTAPFFFDNVLEHGIEACDYLLAVDVDVLTPSRIPLRELGRGYGDVRAVPDLETLRLVPWLELERARDLRLEGLSGRRRRGLAEDESFAGRSSARPAPGFEVRCATELEFFLFRDSYEEAAAKTLARARAEHRHGRGLPVAPDLARRERSTHGCATRCSVRAYRSSTPRVRLAGDSTRSTSLSAPRSRPPTGTSCSRTG